MNRLLGLVMLPAVAMLALLAGTGLAYMLQNGVDAMTVYATIVFVATSLGGGISAGYMIRTNEQIG